MTGASIEATLELWTSSLRGVKERTRPLFAQEQVAASAGASWTACLAMSGARRAGCERGPTGDPGPWRQQAILDCGPRFSSDKRREQGCNAVALMVMGHGSRAALLHGQAGLGAIKRLNLVLFVNRQHQRIVRRIEIRTGAEISESVCHYRRRGVVTQTRWIPGGDFARYARAHDRRASDSAALGSGQFPAG